MTTHTDTVTKEKQISAIKEPGMYKVTFFNDNVTPMDFVVQVLKEIFKHNIDRAEAIMQQIHQNGQGVAGIYTYEIAEQKGVETSVLARESGYPLQVKVDLA
jgi:ATP-dependent Clp protease adaptor protein ClpS|tara:strand:+ start:18278 stop:18583 length:306 start_codon:yes stop_codon:yes gene_type:complete